MSNMKSICTRGSDSYGRPIGWSLKSDWTVRDIWLCSLSNRTAHFACRKKSPNFFPHSMKNDSKHMCYCFSRRLKAVDWCCCWDTRGTESIIINLIALLFLDWFFLTHIEHHQVMREACACVEHWLYLAGGIPSYKGYVCQQSRVTSSTIVLIFSDIKADKEWLTVIRPLLYKTK